MPNNSENFTLINKTKSKLPSLSFVNIKDEILGEKYELSLGIIDSKKIHKLNKQYRNVDSPTDILSFPLDKNFGEIFICPEITKKKAVDFERNYENYFSYLFIHGLVHLLGFDHGKKMDEKEKIYRRKFNI